MKIILMKICLLGVVCFSPIVSHAQIEHANLERKNTKWNIGLSSNVFISNHEFIKNSVGFPGINTEYLFTINPKFQLGTSTDYIYHSGNIHQLTYGLTFNHYIRPQIKILYGLLQQMIKISQFQETSSAHDTMFAFIYEFNQSRRSYFVKVSYHYSRLRYFGKKSIPLDYAGFTYLVKSFEVV